MAAAPEAAMNPENRSPQTFLDWFSEAADVDLENGEPDEIRSFLGSRGPAWFETLAERYAELHSRYPGGVSIPRRKGRRPLVWDFMRTAGDKASMGGIDARLPFFGPLAYEGMVFPDGLALPMWILRSRTREEAEGTPARQQFLQFMDVLVDYLPMLQTGQLAIITENVAYAIAKPRHPHENPWDDKDIEQDLLRRQMEGEILDGGHAISTLIGYLNLTEAFDADPIIAPNHQPAARLLFDYIAQAGYGDAPLDAYSRLPELKFSFHFDRERSPKSMRERAVLLAQLTQDEYWAEVRAVFRAAGEESCRADFNARIAQGIHDINARKSQKPPALISVASDFGDNALGGAVTVGGLALASYVGFDEFRQFVDATPAASIFFGAGAATAGVAGVKKLAARFRDRPFAAPDVLLSLTQVIRDADDEPVSEDERRRREKMRTFIDQALASTAPKPDKNSEFE